MQNIDSIDAVIMQPRANVDTMRPPTRRVSIKTDLGVFPNLLHVEAHVDAALCACLSSRRRRGVARRRVPRRTRRFARSRRRRFIRRSDRCPLRMRHHISGQHLLDRRLRMPAKKEVTFAQSLVIAQFLPCISGK
jgi:hypothetical protein